MGSLDSFPHAYLVLGQLGLNKCSTQCLSDLFDSAFLSPPHLICRQALLTLPPKCITSASWFLVHIPFAFPTSVATSAPCTVTPQPGSARQPERPFKMMDHLALLCFKLVSGQWLFTGFGRKSVLQTTVPCFSSFSAHCHPVDFFHSLNTHCLLWPQDLCTFVLIPPSLSETLSSWLLDSLKLHCCYFLRKAFPASPLPNIPPRIVCIMLTLFINLLSRILSVCIHWMEESWRMPGTQQALGKGMIEWVNHHCVWGCSERGSLCFQPEM